MQMPLPQMQMPLPQMQMLLSLPLPMPHQLFTLRSHQIHQTRPI